MRKLNITFKIVNSGHFLDIFEADCRSASEQLIINVLDFDKKSVFLRIIFLKNKEPEDSIAETIFKMFKM